MPGIVMLAALGSVGLLIWVHPLLGVTGVLLTAWFGYHFLKYFGYQMNSRVSTTDDGVTCHTATGEVVSMPWASVTHAGRFQVHGRLVSVYLYDDEEDRLLKIPPHFSDIDQLEDELASNLDQITHLEGDAEDGLEEALKELLGTDEPIDQSDLE